MRILISGACGFAGSHLARYLLESHEGIEIVGFDNLARLGSETNRLALKQLGVQLVHGDLRMASDVEALPRTDWVIDAAAQPSVLAGRDGKTSPRQLLEHNLSGTINLLEYCRASDAGFILLSTSRVYSIPALSQLPLVVDGSRYALDPARPWPLGITAAGVTEDIQHRRADLVVRRNQVGVGTSCTGVRRRISGPCLDQSLRSVGGSGPVWHGGAGHLFLLAARARGWPELKVPWLRRAWLSGSGRSASSRSCVHGRQAVA